MREEKKCDVGSIEGGMQIQRKVRLTCKYCVKQITKSVKLVRLYSI